MKLTKSEFLSVLQKLIAEIEADKVLEGGMEFEIVEGGFELGTAWRSTENTLFLILRKTDEDDADENYKGQR